jgi:hypothetical protein
MMSLRGKRKKAVAPSSAKDASDVVVRSEGGCKVLIFRKTPPRDGERPIELERGQALSVPDEMEDSEEFRDVSLVYIAERTKRAPTRASLKRVMDEARESRNLVVPRWFKKVLLMTIFTAWTAVAIAISLALAEALAGCNRVEGGTAGSAPFLTKLPVRPETLIRAEPGTGVVILDPSAGPSTLTSPRKK